MKGRKLALVILLFIFQLLSATGVDGSVSSVAYRVFGNAFPLGHYYVYLFIGTPPKPYRLQIDTGSTLTWVQGQRCHLPPDRLYRPALYKYLRSVDPRCLKIFGRLIPEENSCSNPQIPCWIRYQYAGGTKVCVTLALDFMLMLRVDASFHNIRFAIGCAYHLSNDAHPIACLLPGILGLGKGEETILSQLSSIDLIQNVTGHCFQQEGGFLFFGADLVPENGMKWMPLDNCNPYHYCTGPAELLHNGVPCSREKLSLVTFDTGSTYTYLSSRVYRDAKDQIIKYASTNLQDETDGRFGVCWRDTKPIKAVQDVGNYFLTLVLRFSTGAGTIQFDLPPEAYLFATEGRICLGIWDAGVIKGIKDINLIGAISMKNKLIVYDNVKHRIGWASADCSRIKNRIPIHLPHYKGRLYSSIQ